MFSILDNFAYFEKEGDLKPKYLEKATADYSIIGCAFHHLKLA